MRYMVYGVDAASQLPREPLIVDGDSEDEARGRAVAQGMAVRAVIADPASERADERQPGATPQARDSAAAEPDEMRRLRRFVYWVILPLVVLFLLMLAAVRTVWQTATWGTVWALAVLLGGGLAGLLGWLSRDAVPVDVTWPIALTVALTAVSGLHGWRAGWRWWWAKRSLSPLAHALGVRPEEAGDEEPAFLRPPVILAQALAGAVLGVLGTLAGWGTDWHLLTVGAWTGGGALGLGAEGAILGGVLSRHRPLPPPGIAAGPLSDSLAGLLTGAGASRHASRVWVLGYALDRGVPGAVAGTFVGMLAVLLKWCISG
jgi:hypothetical protein